MLKSQLSFTELENLQGPSGLQKSQPRNISQSLQDSADHLLWGDASDSTDHVSDTDSEPDSPTIPKKPRKCL